MSTTDRAPRPRQARCRASSRATARRSSRRCASEFELRQRHAGARSDQDRGQHGRRRGRPRLQADRGRGPRPRRRSPARSRRSTRARKSIAQFKLREGMPIGAHVTLRGDRMWEFLDRLLTLALPRIRDFRGLSPQAVRRHGQLHVRPHRAGHVPRDRPGQDRPRRAAWTSRSSPPRPTTTRAARCCKQLGFPFKEN